MGFLPFAIRITGQHCFLIEIDFVVGVNDDNDPRPRKNKKANLKHFRLNLPAGV